jgi:uncharacterized protein (TIGR02001 family)
MRSFSASLITLSLACVFAVLPLSAQAQGLSFNLGAESRYDGDNQDKNFAPSLQGGVDYVFPNGFYVGNWNATGKYGDQLKSTVEIDLYAGYANELANGVSYDFSVTRYIYADLGSLNANEAEFSMAFGPVSVSYAKSFDSDGFYGPYTLGTTYTHGFTDALEGSVLVEHTKDVSSLNYELALNYDLGNDLSVSGTIQKTKPKFVLGISKGF